LMFTDALRNPATSTIPNGRVRHEPLNAHSAVSPAASWSSWPNCSTSRRRCWPSKAGYLHQPV
jgi:hypothetical protein